MIWFGVFMGVGVASYFISSLENMARQQQMMHDIQTIKTHTEEQAKKIEALEFKLQLAQQKGPFKNELR